MRLFALLLVSLLPSVSKASVYDNLAIYPSTAVHGFTGVVFIAASTATYKAPVITLDGISGNVTAPRFYGDGSHLTGVSGGASLTGVRYSTDPVSVSLINLSTVTAAINAVTPNLTGVRFSTDPVSVGLIDLSTVTMALSGKLSNTSTIPGGLIDLSTYTFGDNLGNHIATMTITAGYGINTSTISATSIGATSINAGAVTISANGPALTLNSAVGYGQSIFMQEAGALNWDLISYPSNGPFSFYNGQTGNVPLALNSDGSSSMSGPVNISSNVYIVGYSSATKYYGDGSALTGITGGSGGDVFKASTQTFTGQNTFSNSVNLPTRDKITFSNEISNSSCTVIAQQSWTQTSHVICISTLTITTQGNSRIEGFVRGLWSSDKASYVLWASYKLDNVAADGGATGYASGVPSAGLNQPLSFPFMTGTLAAGSHSVCFSPAVESTATGTIKNGSGYVNQFCIKEVR